MNSKTAQTAASSTVTLETLALGYLAGGVSLVPCSAETKRPDFNLLPKDSETGKATWKPYQDTPATAEAVKRWFNRGCQSVAAIGGKVSGGLMIIDFDTPRLYEPWKKLVGPLADGLPVQRTGREGGGYQVYLRCDDPGKNDVLAWVPDDTQDSGRTVGIETRGDGGYAVMPGSLHPSGRHYQAISGDFARIPKIHQGQADALIAAAKKLDEMPLTKQQMEAAENSAPACDKNRAVSNGQVSVIDAYNEQIKISDALEKAGYKKNGNRYARPESKNSSVVIIDEKRSFHWDTNDPLCDKHSHSAFDVFCKYSHKDDCKAAVKDAAEILGLNEEEEEGQTEPIINQTPGKRKGAKKSFAAVPKGIKTNPNLQTIIVDTDEKRVADEAIFAVSKSKEIYQRGGMLVHVVRESEPPKGIARPKDSPRIAPIRYARLREIAAESASWVKKVSDGEGGIKLESCHPPEWCIKAIDARGQWSGIRRLEGVVESPIIRADGSILQTPGYDEQTGLIFEPQQPFPPISESMTLADAKRACDQLMEVVIDFPFQNHAHRACWLAGILTPLARYAIDGPSPLFVIDANVRGCGKSLSADATGIIVSGRVMPRMTLPRDDEEFRKRITALAISGEPLILIDNIAGSLGGPSLDAALTARCWTDRILGSTEMAANIPLAMTWYATGNNVFLQADTARRVCHIRLVSPEENPEERSGFHHADLLAFVRQQRPSLAVAAVTILAAYCAAGRPEMKLRPWGSFESWSDLIRSAIVWVGQPDPGETRVELRIQSDREAVALNQLLGGWAEVDPAGRGLTVVQALKILGEFPSDYDALRSALWELCPPKDGKTLNARVIGMKLHHLRHRIMGGRCFDRRDTNKGSIWVVIVADSGDTKDTSDTNPTPRTYAGAHKNPQGAENSVTSPSSVTPPDFAGCSHNDVEEFKTLDGYINRQCRSCGEWLPCQKVKESEF